MLLIAEDLFVCLEEAFDPGLKLVRPQVTRLLGVKVAVPFSHRCPWSPAIRFGNIMRSLPIRSRTYFFATPQIFFAALPAIHPGRE